jgi:hypothetical protein
VSEASVIVVGGRDAELSSLRSLRVVLPSGEGYWTVVDEDYRVVAAADAFLRDLRFGADRTESTTKLYAGGLALFLGWAAGSGRDLERAARELPRFVLLLRTTPITRQGRGYGRPRSEHTAAGDHRTADAGHHRGFTRRRRRWRLTPGHGIADPKRRELLPSSSVASRPAWSWWAYAAAAEHGHADEGFGGVVAVAPGGSSPSLTRSGSASTGASSRSTPQPRPTEPFSRCDRPR